MSLLALGINHKTASVDVRERVAFSPEQLAEALSQARASARVKEVAILSTCNRTELYCSTDEKGIQAILQWLGNYHGVSDNDLEQCVYAHWDDEAARHMMRVASGLDSLVLGEPQILGQLKSAYTLSQESGFLGSELGRLFQQTFSVAKKVRTDTAIGENPVSVAYAAVSLAQHIFSDLGDSRALLIGAGETIELVARHLHNAGVKEITVANRTLNRALDLANEFNGKAILLGDIPDALPQADIVIASTASQLPILGKGAVENALKKRKHRPIFMVDIAVPRDIESQVADLDDVYLYTVDDLREVIEENQRSRETAAREAEDIINQGAHEFMRQLRSLAAVDTVTDLRGRYESIRDQEVAASLKQIANGKPAEEVLAQMARRLTNKMLHHPTIQMRKASAEGRTELLDAAHTLFNLSEPDEK
ncbi:glutamyl-tRNA reductase [Neptunomonas phycophila]|jgi:glutamyl-tRNA reductase|uniref:Glutamyl-tRNA reductase n=1 Tax=Neptunomonas phycophila TaxID=1572645 RepID=A0AAW7XKG9_9GAMM|nr:MULTISPECIES: glutamyl-tRNA reductase [Neptunomonas]MDN2658296.1 glutamyl-tRNA reductase [Neptunomonas sp. CHC150]MDO6454122.1 glutamyl-tRNA reductase [Neptunomonas phycophila]MDP2523281.1 glutamyl-tRNA reductase [Neptunomonas phycophila]